MFGGLLGKKNENEFLEYYKKDNFIEGEENVSNNKIEDFRPVNLFKEYSEGFNNIFTLYHHTKSQHGEVNIRYPEFIKKIINLKSPNNLHAYLVENTRMAFLQPLANGDYEVDSSNIFTVTDNGELLINVTPLYNILIEKIDIDNLSIRDLDIVDFFKKGENISFSNINELYKIAEYFDEIIVQYLYEKFNFKLNNQTKKYNKVISIGSALGTYEDEFCNIFLEKLIKEGIIKNFEINNSGENINNIVGKIFLDDGFEIDLGLINWSQSKDIWYIGTCELDIRIIDFIEKVYYYQKKQTIEQTKDRVNYLVNFTSEGSGRIGESNLLINEQLSSVNGFVDKLHFKKEVVNIKASKIKFFDRRELDFRVSGNFYNIEYVQNYLINTDLLLLGEGKNIDWSKYISLDSGGDRFTKIENIGVPSNHIPWIYDLYNGKNFSNRIDEILDHFLDLFFKEYKIMEDKSFRYITVSYNLLLKSIFGEQLGGASGILGKGEKYTNVINKVKEKYLAKINLDTRSILWEDKYIDDFEKYKEFKEKFDLKITEYHWETTISHVYTNTIKKRELTTEEIDYISNYFLALNNIYIDFVHSDLYKYIGNLGELFRLYSSLGSAATNNTIAHKLVEDLNNFMKDGNKEMIRRIVYIIDKYDFDIQYNQDDFKQSDLDDDSFISSAVLRKTITADFNRLLLTISDDKLKELSDFINKLEK